MKRLLICFDVDGTLIDDTVFIWQTIHEKIQTDPEERRYWTQAFWNKEISYAQWARKDVEMWREKGVDRQTLIAVIEPLKLMPGALDVLNELKKDHYLGIISGSLDIALEKALPDWRHFFDRVYLNTLTFDDAGNLLDVIPTPYDIDRKADGLRKMAEELDVPLSSTVFVGDNYNDVEVAKTAGCSIAFNCKSDALARVCDHVIPGTDLRAVLPVIREFAENSL